MLFRLLTLAFVLGILLTQSVAMLGHAHAGMKLNGHDPRPHIHVTHHGCGHNHAEPDADDEMEQDTVSHPEDDTLLVSVTDWFANESGSVVSSIDTTSFLALPPAFDLQPSRNKLASRTGASRPPPDHPWPLYVRHLALLI